MKRTPVAFAIALILGLCAATGLRAVDTVDTRMLTKPAVSAERIAFVYADDLWTADLEGRNARRLTSGVGMETNPVFSPDGRLVAFSGQYDGNVDAFVVPAAGGIPQRLTWHPAADIVMGFTPDGQSVLFGSSRFSSNRAYSQLFTVPVAGGEAGMLKVPYASDAEISPDGRFIAYCPFPEAFTQWKNYRGGRFSRIWIFDAKDYGIEKLPQPAGRSNDVDPMWAGGKILFRSDRAGEFNLFAFDPATKKVEQLTEFKDFPVLSASAGAGRVVFEQAGALHLYDVAQGRSRRLAIGVAADLAELRERFAKGPQWVFADGVSPTGARAVFEFRGEIVTVPAEKGDPRNLTGTPGVHERNPAWSPDGRSIAYFSDEGGEYALHIRPQDGRGEVKKFELPGAGFYGSPNWSPDSARIAFADNALALFWLDVKTGAVKKIASEYLYIPGGQSSMGTSWSPDSKWIAYTLGTPTFFRRAHVYSVDQDKSFPLTDGLSDVDEPTFDADGKYLWFLASTDAGPVNQWFDMSNEDARKTSALYLATLRKDLPNPLAKESDEEKPKEEKAEAAKPADKAAPAGAKAKPGEPAKPQEALRIDLDGFANRIVAVPIPAGVYGNLQAGEGGKIFYRKEDPPPTSTSGGPGDSSIRVYDLATRKDEAIGPANFGFTLTADRKKMLVASRGAWSILPTAGKAEPGKGKLNVEAVEVRVVPALEWPQIFDEAWRVNRDFFYDPGMHGADPNAQAAEKVNIRQLLNMTSGIGDFFGDRYDATPKEKIRSLKDYLPLFADKPLEFEPGTSNTYSNGGYIVLGLIIEKVAGVDYYKYVRENIFKPCGMLDTDAFARDAGTPNLAKGYTTEGAPAGERVLNHASLPGRGSSAGGGYSTAADMLKYVLALKDKKLYLPDTASGLGIAGGAPGINSMVEWDPRAGTIVIVLTNLDPPAAGAVSRQIVSWLPQ